jgi:hypothetical protein
MRTEKPKKRLVSLSDYLDAFVKKATVCVLMGVCAYTAFVVFRFGGMLLWEAFQPGAGFFAPAMIALGTIVCTVGCVAIWYGYHMFRSVKYAEKVTLITRHNTGDLPEVETLVRSSELPLTDQKAELLRAAKAGKETSPEELLRATTQRRQPEE